LIITIAASFTAPREFQEGIDHLAKAGLKEFQEKAIQRRRPAGRTARS
jgi:hypothetical protein